MGVQYIRDRARAARTALAVPGVKRAMGASALLLSANWLTFIWAVVGMGFFGLFGILGLASDGASSLVEHTIFEPPRSIDIC